MIKRLAAALGAGLLAAVTALAPASALAQSSSCKMVKVAEIPVRFEHNRPRVEASVDGKPVWFLVDTGASSSLIWGGVAQRLGLGLVTAEHVTFYGAGGGQAAQYAIIPDFQLAGVKAKNFRIFAIGRGGSTAEGGLLGRDFWGHWDLEIDLAAKTLRLWSPQGCGDRSLAYWTKDPDVADLRHGDMTDPYLVRLSINGRRVDATLDSGAAVSIITDDLARRVGVTPRNYVGGAIQSMGIAERPFQVRTAQLDKVAIGAEQVSHTTIEVADLFGADREATTGSLLAQHVEGVQTDMLLGADFLRSHRVLLAPDQRRLYFTYSGGPVFEVVGDAVTPQAPAQADSRPPEGAQPSSASAAAPSQPKAP